MYAQHASSACAVKSVRVKSEPLQSLPVSAPLKLELALPDTKKEEVELTADQLKKRRRNERDQRRNRAKRELMERMRKTVAALELQKLQVLQHITFHSPYSRQGDGYRSPLSTYPDLAMSASSLYPSLSMPITRDNYLLLTAEIEEFRRQNAVMVQELAKRDLFNNSLRYRLTSFPPLDSRRGMQPTQLTHEEGITYVLRMLERIHDARLRYASEERFRNRPMFLGWSQYSERQGEVVTFAVKVLRNVTPQHLMDRSWQMHMNDDNLRRLGQSHLQTHITVLQQITNDIQIVDRRTEDQSCTDENGRPLVLRTVYVLFRVADDDGTQTLGIKTLDVPVANRMLRNDEVWWDIFYWIRVSPLDPNAEDDKQEVTTVTEFGGANTCVCEDLATSRRNELIFLAIRWETVAVAPFLLKQ